MLYELTSLEAKPSAGYAHAVAFGKNVKRIRLELEMQSKELARRLGVKPSAVSGWESDKRGLPEGPTLIRFAKALGCSVDALLAGVDPAYDEIVIKQRDLVGHKGIRESESQHGGSDVSRPTTAARIHELEQELSYKTALIRKMQEPARRLFALTAAAEDRPARTRKAQRRGAHRKAG